MIGDMSLSEVKSSEMRPPEVDIGVRVQRLVSLYARTSPSLRRELIESVEFTALSKGGADKIKLAAWLEQSVCASPGCETVRTPVCICICFLVCTFVRVCFAIAYEHACYMHVCA